MKEHTLKIKWKYLIDVLDNGKNFEIRKNDRDFNKGDTIKFIPVDLCGNIIANPSIDIPIFKITYVFYGGEYGLDEDYCVFGIEPMKDEVSSHSESDILKECISLMHELVDDFAKWYEYVHGENAIAELGEEERFCVRKSYFSIVQQLFLFHTKHSGGGSTCAKCHELGIKDWSEDIEFGFEVEEDERR